MPEHKTTSQEDTPEKNLERLTENTRDEFKKAPEERNFDNIFQSIKSSSLERTSLPPGSPIYDEQWAVRFSPPKFISTVSEIATKLDDEGDKKSAYSFILMATRYLTD